MEEDLKTEWQKSSDVYYDWIRNIPILDHDEQIRLARLYKAGDKEAGNTLVKHNLRIVFKAAGHCAGCKVPFEDIIQEGNLGLIKALEKFDPERGYKFPTYAVWWVRQRIQRHLQQFGSGGLIRIPPYLGEINYKILGVEKKLRNELGMDPTIEEIACELNIDVEKIKKLKIYSAEAVDLFGETYNGFEGATYASILKDPEALDPAELFENEELKIVIDNILSEFTPKEKAIMIMLYGLDGKDTRSLGEVAKEFNVSRERIRQIKVRAMDKLKHNKKRRKRLHDFY